MENPSPGSIYNVADDLPSTRYDVLSYACRLMNYPVQNPGSNKLKSKYSATRGGSKRVDNTKIQKLLIDNNACFKYPDYRIGLKDLWNNFPLDAFDDSVSDGTRVNEYDIDTVLPKGENSNSDRNSDSLIEELRENVHKLENKVQLLQENQRALQDLLSEISRISQK